MSIHVEVTRLNQALPSRSIGISTHAIKRMTQRGISLEAARIALETGRVVHVRGATFFFLGRRQLQKSGLPPAAVERLDGVHVVVDHGCVVTVYKNRSLRHLRPRRRVRRSKNRVQKNAWLGAVSEVPGVSLETTSN